MGAIILKVKFVLQAERGIARSGNANCVNEITGSRERDE